MKIKLQATTSDLDHLAEAIGEGRRTDKAGMVKVSRDALARLVVDHSRVLGVLRADAVIDVIEADSAGPPGEDPEVAEDDAAPALLTAMGAAT
jgi:hypothetical protein